MTAIDTNVIIDLDTGTQEVAEAALGALEQAGARGRMVVCGIVFAELCAHPSWTAEVLRDVLSAARIEIASDLSLDVWFRAGDAYAIYARRRRRERGDAPRRIVADFVIGAHAQTVGSLVTNDTAFYRRCFPDLPLTAPSVHPNARHL